MQKHVAIIDVIRGVAAISVSLLHIREINWIGMRSYWKVHGIDMSLSSFFAYLSFPMIWGSIGVPIFFVISGYVIHSGSKEKIINLNHAQKFWVRRSIRIYPTLLSALIVTLICDMFASNYEIHERFGDLSIQNAIFNLLGVIGFIGSPYGSNGALWSLSIEIQFYAIYPLALMFWRRIGPTKMLLVTLVFTLIGYLLFWQYKLTTFLFYYFSWWLGAYVADRKIETESTRKQLWIGVSVLVLGCIIFFARNDILTHMVWSIGFAIILGYMLDRESRNEYILKNKGIRSFIYNTLGKCGNFSYSLYAVHLPIAVAFNVVLLNGEKQQSIFWVALVFPVTLVGAYIIYRTVEVPSIRILSKIPR